MIINLRGNHASGKSTTVRKVLAQFPSTPIYGMLGPRAPEAYRCERKGKPPFYVLGAYSGTGAAASGCDPITKKGMTTTVEFLEAYSQKGDILFESILMSVRFMAPTIGGWLLKHKPNVLVAILDTTLEQCKAALTARQGESDFHGGDKHLAAQDRQFRNVQATLKKHGFRIEYVNRDNAADKIIGWLS